MTEQEIRKALRGARRNGYTLARGDYTDTSENRLDRWYWDWDGESYRDRRGQGFATRRDALEIMPEVWE